MNMLNGGCHMCATGAYARTAPRILMLLSWAIAGLVIATHPAFAGEDARVPLAAGLNALQASVEKQSFAPTGASGIVVHVHPQTGAIIKVPVPGSVPLRLTPYLLNANSTAHEGLVKVPSSLPGGGFKIDLQGRFQSSLLATVDANGKITVQHVDLSHALGEAK